jgi:hypothetical protein
MRRSLTISFQPVMRLSGVTASEIVRNAIVQVPVWSVR